MMILHYWRVNSAAERMTAAAMRIFRMLHSKIKTEMAATAQHI